VGNPLRVLHVVVNMNRGGAETLIMNLYRNIDRKKVQFDFLTCKPGVFDVEIKKMGGRIYRIPYISDVGHFQYVKGLDEFFLEHKEYDIVHSHLDKMSGLVLKSAKKAGVQVRIAHSHNTRSEGNLVSRIYKEIIGKYVLQHCSHKFACSREAGKWLFKTEKNILVKNGIDLVKFKPNQELKRHLKDELHINENTFILGHIGRFCVQKNHQFLINIFKEIVALRENSLLILIGDGPLQEKIMEQAKGLKLEEKIWFLGVRDDVHRLVHLFDAMVFPSFHEGLPVTLIEVQGSGVPCVISNSITKEVDQGLGLVKFLNLKEDPRSWAESVIDFRPNVSNTTVVLQKNGYDIKITAKWVMERYIQLSNKEDNRIEKYPFINTV
jgi:glycosyltransferase involved in cell wall biosynthesis